VLCAKYRHVAKINVRKKCWESKKSHMIVLSHLKYKNELYYHINKKDKGEKGIH